MNPEDLLNCEMCEHRAEFLRRLNEVALRGLALDMAFAYGIHHELPAAVADVARTLDAIIVRLHRDMEACKGEPIAHPLGDDGY